MGGGVGEGGDITVGGVGGVSGGAGVEGGSVDVVGGVAGVKVSFFNGSLSSNS
jgi:hypothetical protein